LNKHREYPFTDQYGSHSVTQAIDRSSKKQMYAEMGIANIERTIITTPQSS